MMIQHDNLVLHEERRYQLKRQLEMKLAFGLRHSEPTQAYFEKNTKAIKRACQIAKQHISYMLSVTPTYTTVREVQSPEAVVVAVLVSTNSEEDNKLYDVIVDLTRTKVIQVIEIE
jgi:predicted small secreted protein